MGVQGLATLLEAHSRIYREVQFRRSRLVVDGCNLMYLLYFNSGRDSHGTEYSGCSTGRRYYCAEKCRGKMVTFI